MKKMLPLIAIVVVIAVVLVLRSNRTEERTSSAKSTRDITPIVISGTEEEKERTVRGLTARARADMRNMAVGLESFFIDHSRYPADLHELTTPIAYFTRIMNDSFTQNTDMGYEKREPKDWILWSIGPDGEDNSGDLVFDSTNGAFSDGDIIRVKQ